MPFEWRELSDAADQGVRLRRRAIAWIGGYGPIAIPRSSGSGSAQRGTAGGRRLSLRRTRIDEGVR
jgi:hypothetical protein